MKSDIAVCCGAPKLAGQITLAVVAHDLLGQAEGNDLAVAVHRDNATHRPIALVIRQIFGVLLAYFKNSCDICVQVVHMVI